MLNRAFLPQQPGTIWKYPVPVLDDFSISMPQGARLLCVQLQHGEPQVWAAVDPEKPAVNRWFRLVGTGHNVDLAAAYVGSFQLYEGALVFHLFDEGEET